MNRILIAALIMLQGCQGTSHFQKSTTEYSLTRPVMKNENQAPPLEAVLLHRVVVCKADRETRNELFTKYQSIMQPWANLERLLLASCQPEFTPGILKNELSRMKKDDSWPSYYQALTSLIEAHILSNEVVTQQKQKEIDKLNQTIEALTKIEQDMNSREQ